MKVASFYILMFVFMFASIVTIAACSGSEANPEKITVVKPIEAEKTKWTIQSEGYFNAGYENHYREILRITSPDGHTFIGITGVGVTEVHTEQRGKTTVTVEE